MILYQFRRHLAEQIGHFPVEPNEATQSYAVTTAALARKILDFLNAKDLTLPNGLNLEEPPYKLGTVLDRIIHFKTLGQDAISFDYPGKPDLVTLYSDKNLPFADHIHFRLSDYREAMERLANDDLFVGHYLLRQAISLMGKAEKTIDPESYEEEYPYYDLQRSVHWLIANAWAMVYSLDRSGKIEMTATPFDCYEELRGGRHGKTYDGITTCKEFLDGYLTQWTFAASIPYKVEVAGSEIHCVLLDAKRTDGKQGILGLALPFTTISSIFTDIQIQIAEALSQTECMP